MNISRTRIPAVLLMLLFAFLSAFHVFAEGGDGSGGGENHDKPLILARSSIHSGAENVDPNVHIVLTFNKNVVNIVVRENNMQCFSVMDSKGAAVPISVVMGDDQVEPTDEVKHNVTIMPKSPYKAGETYVLKISRDLAAKNGRDKLDKDVYLSFTIREQTTTAYVAPARVDSPNNTTTTTTKKSAETTTKRAMTTRPVISAAAGTTAKKAETTTQNAKPATTTTTTKQAVTATVSQSLNFAEPFSLTTTTTAKQTETVTASGETALSTEPATIEDTTAVTVTLIEVASPEAETTAQTPDDASEETESHRSPLLIPGIIAPAVAGALIGIIYSRKKKG